MRRLQVKILCLCLFLLPEKSVAPKVIFNKAIRDPFHLSSKSLKSRNQLAIKLLGIVRSADKFGAVLEFGSNVETVFLNDSFCGFKILAIKPGCVELIRGKAKKRLFVE